MRRAATSILPELLHSAVSANEKNPAVVDQASVKSLLDFIVPPMVSSHFGVHTSGSTLRGSYLWTGVGRVEGAAVVDQASVKSLLDFIVPPMVSSHFEFHTL